MAKLLYLATIAVIFLNLTITDVNAIPKHDKKPVIEDSISIFDHYPSKEPSSADDYHKLGAVYLSRGMFQIAYENFQKALELDPKHLNSLMGVTASTLQKGDTESALEYSERAFRIEPDNAKLRNAIGVVWMTNATSPEHLDKSEAIFKEAISLDSKFIPLQMNLAWLYMSKRKLDEAIKEYQNVIKIDPGNLAAHRGLVTAYSGSGSTDKALLEAEKIVKLSPQDPVSYNALGEAYARKGQLDKALSAFQKAVETEPNYAPGYENIGNIYLLQALPDKAIKEFQTALARAPNYGLAHAGLGNAYLVKEMYQKAAEEYRNAISEDSVGFLPITVRVSIYNNLGYIYAEEGQDLDKALSLVQRAKELIPTQPDVSDTLGWIYYKKGLYDEAVTNLKDAAEQSPENPTIRYHLGAAYYKQGAKEEAAAELREALKIGDDFKEIEDVKDLLTELEK